MGNNFCCCEFDSEGKKESERKREEIEIRKNFWKQRFEKHKKRNRERNCGSGSNDEIDSNDEVCL